MRFATTPLLRAATLAVGLLAFAACDSGDDEPLGEPVNGIPRAEFDAGVVPDYIELDAALDAVLAADPDIVDDSPRFTRAVFDEVNRSVAPDAKHDLRSFLGLTKEEYELLMDNPVLSYSVWGVAYQADIYAQRTYPCGASLPNRFNDDKADAVRHALWMARTAESIADLYGVERGLEFAERLGTAHESESIGDELSLRRRAMDLSNNAAGRAVFQANPDAGYLDLQALVSALPFEFVEAADAITFDPTRLVYFANRADFDVSMTGSFTNPDSGGPWDAVLNLTQCNDTIRGGLEITRGDDERQQRGVAGVVDGNTLDLQIGFPIGGGFSACRNMEAQLSGSPTSLSGPWTSSNCSRGGQFSLTASPS